MYQIAKEIIGNSMREPNFKKFLLSPPLTSSRASSCGNEIANRRKNSSTARYSRHGHKNKRKKEFYYNTDKRVVFKRWKKRRSEVAKVLSTHRQTGN